MDIVAFMCGMLLRFWSFSIPKNTHEALRTTILCVNGGLLLWLIRASQGNLFGILSAALFAYGAYKTFFLYRKSFMPYLNELHIVIWNILLMYAAGPVYAFTELWLYLIIAVSITSIYVLLPFRPNTALRALLYYYACSVILGIHLLLIWQSQPVFLSLLRGEDTGFGMMFIAGLDACGLFAAISLVVRVDLYSKHDSYKLRMRRYREYAVMAERFFVTQFSLLFLFCASAILAVLLWANGQYDWLPASSMLTFSVIGCNLLANIPSPESSKQEP